MEHADCPVFCVEVVGFEQWDRYNGTWATTPIGSTGRYPVQRLGLRLIHHRRGVKGHDGERVHQRRADGYESRSLECSDTISVRAMNALSKSQVFILSTEQWGG